jgi:hypothetical protein
MAQETAPAALRTDRFALPRNPVESTALRMPTMGAGNGVTSSSSLRGGHLTEQAPTTGCWRRGCPKKPKPGVMPWIC